MMCQRFGYDKIASAVSGTDGVDVACKIARKWAIAIKCVVPSELLILGVSGCFHGLASGVWGLQDQSQKRKGECITLPHLQYLLTQNQHI
jgi:ornithine--oxo-acid transaminase